MSKAEFLEQLRLSLNGRIDADQVLDNLRYYEEYINSQLRQGKTEEEVMSMLGSPRLIARTITDAQSDGADGYAEYEQDAQGFGRFGQGYGQDAQGFGRFGQGFSSQAYGQYAQNDQDAQGFDGDGYAERDQEAWNRFAQGPFGQAFFNRTRQEVTRSDKPRFGRRSFLVKYFMLPEGLRKLVGISIVFGILVLFFWILKFLFPILLIGGIAIFLIKLFKDWLR